MTEEDMQLVTDAIVPLIMKKVTEMQEQSEDNTFESIKSIIDVLADVIATNSYEHQRDMSYIKTMLRSVEYSCEKPKSFIEDAYDSYCKEYDKLNKHLLDEKLAIKNKEPS